jgi:L-tyrosine peroxygenase
MKLQSDQSALPCLSRLIMPGKTSSKKLNSDWHHAPAGSDNHPINELFWFRWMAGHQATFGIWLFLDAALTEPDSLSLTWAAQLTDLYSAMLLYCGSMPIVTYTEMIRPAMIRHHPAFSGHWSADYATIRAKSARAASSAEVYRVALQRNRETHEFVARTLVIDGVSLLRQHRRSPDDTPKDRDVTGVLFDSFFGTVRAPVTPAQVRQQTQERLMHIATDLQNHGLYPAGKHRSSSAEINHFQNVVFDLVYEGLPRKPR